MKFGLKYYLKEAVFGTLDFLMGEHKGLRAILLYHSVDRQFFAKQMSYLSKNCRFVLLRDLRGELLNNNTEENLICCTFDDGRLNNYTTALPILQDFGLKATFFVVSGLVGRHMNDNPVKSVMMNAHQVNELASLGHEIGAHTVCHPVLTQISLDDARAEIVQSKSDLEDMTGSPVVSFAYPKGIFNGDIRDLVEQAGFNYGVSVIEGLLRNASVDWLVLPRVGIDQTVGPLQFRAKVSTALELYENLRGRR